MKYTLSILFVCLFVIGHAQNYFEIAKVSYTNTPQNDFEITDAQTTVEELAFELNFPIVINEKTVLITGIYANKTKVKLDANVPNSKLNVLGFNVGVNTTFNDKWSATFMVFPKIASDELKITGKNMQLALLSLFTNKNRENLKYKYGIYANTENYGLIIVPIIGLYYVSTNQKFEANLNLPIIADLNYKIDKKMWLGIKFDGLGTTYNLMDQNYSDNGVYVSKTSNELLSYLRFQLSQSLYINTKIGYAISRNYKIYDAKDKISFALTNIYFGDDRTQLNERFKDGAIFKIELLYRINL
jgi:hypothetical protein